MIWLLKLDSECAATSSAAPGEDVWAWSFKLPCYPTTQTASNQIKLDTWGRSWPPGPRSSLRDKVKFCFSAALVKVTVGALGALQLPQPIIWPMQQISMNVGSRSGWALVCIPWAAAAVRNRQIRVEGTRMSLGLRVKITADMTSLKLIQESAQQRFSLSPRHLTVPDDKIAFKRSLNNGVQCNCTLQEQRKAWRSSKRWVSHRSTELWSPCEMKFSLHFTSYSAATMWHGPFQEILFCRIQKVSRFENIPFENPPSK